MAENYKALYEQMKKMVSLYQDEIVPNLRKEFDKRMEVVRKPVRGYEEQYVVDQFGRVFGVDRTATVLDNGRIYEKPIEKRSFGGYTQYPNIAEVYSLEDWAKSGYNNIDWMKLDEPVSLCINFCKKYKKYDTVLVPLEQYIKYCECAGLALNRPKNE